jgi:hypothetical protein
VGNWAYAVYIVACPGIVFRLFSLVYVPISGRAPARLWLVRLVTVPVGMILAAVVASSASGLSQQAFEAAYAPFVAEIGSRLPDPCRGGDYFGIPAVSAYNRSTAHGRLTARLFHDDKRYVAAFPGGSIDIDGSTIYYDSRAAAWRRFHNDDGGARERFDGLTAGLTECRLAANEAGGGPALR